MELPLQVFLSNAARALRRRRVMRSMLLTFLLTSITLPTYGQDHLTIAVEDDRSVEKISNVKQIESSRQYVARQVEALRSELEEVKRTLAELSKSLEKDDADALAQVTRAVTELKEVVKAQATRIDALERAGHDDTVTS